MKDTLIIGAGPAGLTAAYELSKLGCHATILEAGEQVGGLSRTVNYQGFRFDIGGHRFFSKVAYINELWDEILSQGFLSRPRLSRILYRGHFFDYPIKAFDALSSLGPVETLLVSLSYAKAKFVPQRNETNFEQWVSNRFGYRLYEIFFKTYTEKVWGMPCTEISADWAAQRIKNLSLAEALRNAVFSNGRTKNGDIITTLIDQFKYPRLGPGMMWERCEELLAQQGNKTLQGARVSQICHRNDRVECIKVKRESGAWEGFSAEQFISTMPLRDLVHVLEPAPPYDVLKAASLLKYRDYLTVVLILNRQEVFPDNWIYIHSPEVRMGRIQNYKNWSKDMVPNPRQTSLGLEYFLWANDDEWNWSDERLIDLGIRECVQLSLIDPKEVQDGVVVRAKKAYPIYDGVYQQSLMTIKSYLKRFSNLQTIGRNGLHRYNNQDHSMLTGVYAARNIVGEGHDVWAVNFEKEYHEESLGQQTKPVSRLTPTVSEPATTAKILPQQVLEEAFAELDGVAFGIAVGLVSGLGLFLATAILLLKGGEVIGPNLSLLEHYFFGFKVTWLGASLGLAEGVIGGFFLGSMIASLRNWGIGAYAKVLKLRALAKEERDILDKIR